MRLLCFFVTVCCLQSVVFAAPHAKHCAEPHHLVIAAVGDVLLHEPLQRKASQQGFVSLWQQALPILQSADITYGNVEGPLAHGVSKSGNEVFDPGHRYDDNVYSSYPLFNYHPKLAAALASSGFDIVSTANNHALDRFALGVDRTIANLTAAGIKTIGTRARGSDAPWYQVIQRRGFSIAWIACTEDTNGIKDKAQQILYCYRRDDRKRIVELVSSLSQRYDAVIVSPHWGVQYMHQPNQQQQRFAKDMLAHGALMVIGSHPHVLQPMVRQQDSRGRNGLIAYSLGNFVSYQGTPKNRATVILLIDLHKQDDGVTRISDVRYIPAYMRNRHGHQHIELRLLTADDHRSMPYHIIRRILPQQYWTYADDIRRSACFAKRSS